RDHLPRTSPRGHARGVRRRRRDGPGRRPAAPHHQLVRHRGGAQADARHAVSSASRTAGTRPVAPPLSEAHLVDPAATDAWLLAEAPVCYVPERDLYLVSGFAEATAVLTDHRRFSNRFGRVMRGYERLGPRARQVLERGWPPRDVLFTVDE